MKGLIVSKTVNKTVKIYFETTTEKLQHIENLMQITNCSTKKDFLNNAITILEWSINEISKNRKVVSLNCEDGNCRELVMPIFSYINKQ